MITNTKFTNYIKTNFIQTKICNIVNVHSIGHIRLTSETYSVRLHSTANYVGGSTAQPQVKTEFIGDLNPSYSCDVTDFGRTHFGHYTI